MPDQPLSVRLREWCIELTDSPDAEARTEALLKILNHLPQIVWKLEEAEQYVAIQRLEM